MLRRNRAHQDSLILFGQTQKLDVTTAAKCEQFVCDLYPSSKRTPNAADELRYLLFCLKKQKNEMLPPTSESLLQHVKRANYQTYIWRHLLDAMQDLNSPDEHGWEKEEDILKPVLMTKERAPKSLLELTTCQCKKSECRTNCSCNNAGLSCTESCVCMADERCQNPHGAPLYSSESDGESDSD